MAGKDGKNGHRHKPGTSHEYLDVIYHVGDRYYKGLINIIVERQGHRFKDMTQIRDITDEIHAKYGEDPETVFVSQRSKVSESTHKKEPSGSTQPEAHQPRTEATPQRLSSAGMDGYEAGSHAHRSDDSTSITDTTTDVNPENAQNVGNGVKHSLKTSGNGGNGDENGNSGKNPRDNLTPETTRERAKDAQVNETAGKVLNNLAKTYRDETRTLMKLADVREGLNAIVDAYAKGEDASAEADKLARQIIDQSMGYDREFQQKYKEVRRRLREEGFKLTETQEKEI